MIPALAYTPDLRHLDDLPLHPTSAPLLRKALEAPRKSRPYQFAVGVPLTLTLDQGRWDAVDTDTARWRTRVFSAGAASLHFEFAQFHMPDGGELWIYDAAGRLAQGPYTQANHTPEGKLWTALVPGDTAVIEARVPAAQRDALQLRLGVVQHGYTDFFKTGIDGSSESGACNINVACPQGNTWGKEIRSVALVESRGLVCSGVLVNDVAQGAIPYLLTANHCGIRAGGGNPASSVVVYWQFQSSTCNGNTGDPSKNQSGASFLMTHAESDFTLLRLNQTPAASFDVYYAGWDVSGAAAQSGVGLHHPSGDIKKISVFSTPLTQAMVPLNGAQVQTWRVERWDQGVTEQGSSGSGLWDQNHRVVGLLSGGQAQCTVDNSDPAQPLGPTQPDFYGRLDVAWNNGLKTHLDPNNSGLLIQNGCSPQGSTCIAEPQPSAAPSPGGGGGGGAWSLMSLLVLALIPASRARRFAPASPKGRR